MLHRWTASMAAPIVCIQRVKVRSRASRRGWPGVSGGLDLGGPPAARRAIRPGACRIGPRSTWILLTRLLTTDLDGCGQGWNRQVIAWRVSGRYGQRRPDLDEPDLATGQKVGVRVPPSAPPNPQVEALVTSRHPHPRRPLALFWPYHCPRRRLRRHCRGVAVHLTGVQGSRTGRGLW